MSRTLTASLAVTVVAVAVAVSAPAPQAQQTPPTAPYYVVVDLGTLGGTDSVAEGINDSGSVVGTANQADQTERAFLWRDGSMTNLGTLGGPNSSEEWAVNDSRGLIAAVGETPVVDPLGENFCGFDTGLICRGFLWRDGRKTPLATLGGNNSQALSVNDSGHVVGYAETATHDPNCSPPQQLDFEAVIWGPNVGQIQQLPTLGNDTVSGASGINDLGQVIGVSGTCSAPTSHGVLWQNGTVTDLRNLGGVLNTTPYSINSRGDVVGQSDLLGDATTEAFLWTKDGGMQGLGTLPEDAWSSPSLPDDSWSSAYGTNDEGQVVGASCVDGTFSSCRAFVWQDGVMKDLNALVRRGSTPLDLFIANDINASGEIAAYAENPTNGDFHAVLLVPCDANNAEDAVCRNNAAATTAGSSKPAGPSLNVPATVRRQLDQRLSLGLDRAGAFTAYTPTLLFGSSP